MVSILIIAAHPDDEALGMGATIKKLSKNNEIHLCVMTEGSTAQYSDKKMKLLRKKSCLNAGKILGISTFDFFDYPDMKLDTISHLELNRRIEKIIEKYKPKIVFTTPDNDLNKDHQITLESTLVATRPKSKVKEVLAYEIPSYIKKEFKPNVFFDIEKEFSFKIDALKQYKSEIEEFPCLRSVDYLDSLSKIRGAQSGNSRAEAFRLLRKIIV